MRRRRQEGNNKNPIVGYGEKFLQQFEILNLNATEQFSDTILKC